MSAKSLAAAVGLEFEVALISSDGVIVAESETARDAPEDRFALLLRDLGREVVRTAALFGPEEITAKDLLDGVNILQNAAFASPPDKVRTAAIKLAVVALRAGTEPGSPISLFRAPPGKTEGG